MSVLESAIKWTARITLLTILFFTLLRNNVQLQNLLLEPEHNDAARRAVEAIRNGSALYSSVISQDCTKVLACLLDSMMAFEPFSTISALCTSGLDRYCWLSTVSYYERLFLVPVELTEHYFINARIKPTTG